MDNRIWKNMRTWIKVPSTVVVTHKGIGKVDELLLERVKNASFPDPVVALYATFDGFHQKWTAKAKGVEGSINILASKHLFDDTRVALDGGVEWFVNDKAADLKVSYFNQPPGHQ